MSQQPTQEELAAYVQQLRDASAPEIVLQAFSLLATGAEAKLGRPDARVLIDAIAGLVSSASGHLGQVGPQLESAVKQLQLAQVQAERSAGGDAAADGETTAAAPAAAPQPASPPPGERAVDRLWIPGRDPRPR